MKKNKTFKTPKKFNFVVSASMPVRFGKTSKMVNHLLQNCDRVVFMNPPYAEACQDALVQKIGRACVAV